MKLIKQLSVALLVLSMIFTTLIVPGGGEVASANTSSSTNTDQVTLICKLDGNVIGTRYYTPDEPVNLNPANIVDAEHQSELADYSYWKCNTLSGGPYFGFDADYVVFHKAQEYYLDVATEGLPTDYRTVTYKSSSSDDAKILVMYYEHSQSNFEAQYCGFVEEGYKFTWWVYSGPGGGIVYPGNPITSALSSITLIARITVVTTPLIIVPKNICVETGGTFDLGYTAIGLDSTHTLNANVKVVDSSSTDVQNTDKVGIYTIKITVNDITDSSGKSVKDHYSINAYDGIMVVYGGEHSFVEC